MVHFWRLVLVKIWLELVILGEVIVLFWVLE